MTCKIGVKMAIILNIGLDLGGDTLKVAYSYADKGRSFYGKVVDNTSPTQLAIPSVAFYRTETKEWLFGYDVDNSGEEDFVTVVKIKDLLSLLKEHATVLEPVKGTDEQQTLATQRNEQRIKESEQITKKNAEYYASKKYFPKFHFPTRKAFLSNFEDMVNESEVFEADETPKMVCQMYFAYVYKLVKAFIVRLQARKNVVVSEIEVGVVRPPKACDAYHDEVARLVKETFGVEPKKELSSTKAISVFASHRNLLRTGDSFLIFDLGEESISVIKGKSGYGGRVTVDGETGHKPPLHLGGADVDAEIAKYLEQSIHARETMGTPSAGEEGHIYEDGLRSKQYLGIGYIKKAKMILSRPLSPSSCFAKGVPVSLIREVRIQRLLTREDMMNCLGMNNNTRLAKMISDYIFEELNMTASKDVNKVFLCGGLAETYGLKEMIEARARREKPNVRFCSFEQEGTTNDGFAIQEYEDAVYASAVGASLASMLNYDLSTVLTYSYGTWLTDNGRKYLRIFVDKGTEIKLAKGQKWKTFPTDLLIGGMGPEREEIYSINITQADLQSMVNGRLYLGEMGSTERRRNELTYGLETKAGGDNGEIRLYYGTRRIRLPYIPNARDNRNRFRAKEGISVNADGLVQPFIANAYELEHNEALNTKVKINFIDEMATIRKNKLSNLANPNHLERSKIEWQTKEYEIDSKYIKIEFSGVEGFTGGVSE